MPIRDVGPNAKYAPNEYCTASPNPKPSPLLQDTRPSPILLERREGKRLLTHHVESARNGASLSLLTQHILTQGPRRK